MANDNYKASDASLVDQPEPQMPARPRNVMVAIGLIVGALLVQLLGILTVLQAANFYVANPRGIIIIAAEFVLLGVISHQIAQARRWARLVLLILTLVNFARICWGVGYIWWQAPEAWDLLVDPHYLLTNILPLLMNMVALHLLYFSSGDWFRRESGQPGKSSIAS
jgi:filamentous hemagglutinin family protein